MLNVSRHRIDRQIGLLPGAWIERYASGTLVEPERSWRLKSVAKRRARKDLSMLLVSVAACLPAEGPKALCAFGIQEADSE